MAKSRAKSNQSKRDSSGITANAYQVLENRQVLASIFPTYIDGVFTFGDGAGAATPYDLADTFKLESNPTATKTIYLDFDGHHSVNNDWNHSSGGGIQFPSFDRDGDVNNFTNAELLEIQLQFQNVAEDFLQFNVNVTTMDPGLDALTNSGGSDQTWGVRAVNTQATGGFGNGIGGVAFLNSFGDSIDNPVFTFNKGENNGAMTNSHEVGHALGLRHDGLNSSTYHPGGGSGETSWGPIMGAPFGANLVQWSNGNYAGSTNGENDNAIITKASNGFGYKADDYGNTIATATDMSQGSTDDIFEWGFIRNNADADMFRFEADGQVDIDVLAFGERPNLDIRAQIFDSTFKKYSPSGKFRLKLASTPSTGFRL